MQIFYFNLKILQKLLIKNRSGYIDFSPEIVSDLLTHKRQPKKSVTYIKLNILVKVSIDNLIVSENSDMISSICRTEIYMNYSLSNLPRSESNGRVRRLECFNETSF
jgi:hypothetical protein